MATHREAGTEPVCRTSRSLWASPSTRSWSCEKPFLARTRWPRSTRRRTASLPRFQSAPDRRASSSPRGHFGSRTSTMRPCRGSTRTQDASSGVSRPARRRLVSRAAAKQFGDRRARGRPEARPGIQRGRGPDPDREGWNDRRSVCGRRRGRGDARRCLGDQRTDGLDTDALPRRPGGEAGGTGRRHRHRPDGDRSRLQPAGVVTPAIAVGRSRSPRFDGQTEFPVQR